MIKNHLSEIDLQQYALSPAESEPDLISHISICSSCKQKAETYQQLFSAIEQQAAPFFDFDLENIVLSQIAPNRRVSNSVFYVWLLILPAGLFISVLGWFFGDYLVNLITAISSMALYLLLTITATFLSFQAFDMYKKYRKQMDALNY